MVGSTHFGCFQHLEGLETAPRRAFPTLGVPCKAAFDSFKNRSDLVASELNTALAAIVTGQSGMNTAFTQGDQTASDNARRSEGAANFDAARFQGRA